MITIIINWQPAKFSGKTLLHVGFISHWKTGVLYIFSDAHSLFSVYIYFLLKTVSLDNAIISRVFVGSAIMVLSNNHTVYSGSQHV